MALPSVLDLVIGAPGIIGEPLFWFRVPPRDRPVVSVGDEVTPGDPLMEPVDGPTPGALTSPVRGSVRTVDGRGVAIAARGIGMPASIAFGQAVRGPLTIGVRDRFAELPASSVDVSVAGSILVAGARVGIEALTRARALGALGVISGGISGRDLERLSASESRHRAVHRPLAHFGLVCLDGYGARPIASRAWRLLVAAAGTEVALGTDPPMVVFDAGERVNAEPTGLVRVVSGPYLGREGRPLRPCGLIGTAATGLHPAALVALSPAIGGGAPEHRIVALADLERLD